MSHSECSGSQAARFYLREHTFGSALARKSIAEFSPRHCASYNKDGRQTTSKGPNAGTANIHVRIRTEKSVGPCMDFRLQKKDLSGTNVKECGPEVEVRSETKRRNNDSVDYIGASATVLFSEDHCSSLSPSRCKMQGLLGQSALRSTNGLLSQPHIFWVLLFANAHKCTRVSS